MKKKLKNINSHLPTSIDLFLTCSSFEDRCLTISKHIDVSRVKKTLVFYNDDQRKLVKDRAEQLCSFFLNAELIAFDSNNSLTIADKFLHIFLDTELSNKNIVVDITTFTHEALLILLKVLTLFKKETSTILLVYNSASAYCHEVKSKEEIWLSKGLKDKRTILGYPGKTIPYQSFHFIMLVGYEIERAKLLIEAYEPEFLSLGLGAENESIDHDLYLVNKHKYENLKIIYKDIGEFDFSCIHPISTAKSLLQQINRFPNYNVVISPMNNKISTLGCGLLAINKPDIQIIYSRANIYNTECYSISSKDFYIFEFNNLLQTSRLELSF
jgi:hypothetical protein